MIKFLQCNLDRRAVATAELRNKAVEEGIGVLILQEPYTVGGKVVGLGVGSRVVSARVGQPWAAVAVLEPDLVVSEVGSLCDEYCVCAEVRAYG